MDALPSFLSERPVRAVPPAVAAGERARPEQPAASSDLASVGVEFSQRRDGVQVLKFIDRRTGVVISQTPPEQVLAVVDALVAAIQRKEA